MATAASAVRQGVPVVDVAALAGPVTPAFRETADENGFAHPQAGMESQDAARAQTGLDHPRGQGPGFRPRRSDGRPAFPLPYWIQSCFQRCLPSTPQMVLRFFTLVGAAANSGE